MKLPTILLGVANVFVCCHLLCQSCNTICGQIQGEGGGPVNFCAYPQNGCPPNLEEYEGCCCTVSPILIDAYGEGFHLTGVKEGVKIRLLAGTDPVQVSWTDARWHNGWLVLDRNGNGKIDDFTELFGNFTFQPTSRNPNGFAALAVFDQPSSGGKGNGLIDPGDHL